MVARILVWLVVAVVAWWLLRPRARVAPPGAAPASASASAAPGTVAETMVDCAACGLHFPASEALRDGTAHAYCTPAHRDAGPRRG